MHRFYTPKTNFEGDHVWLGVDETHHLRDVLRHGIGDDVHVFDGEGNENLCRVEKVTKSQSTLAIVKKVSASSPESPFDITLAVALLKGEKFDLVLQKAVELGISRIVPLITMRCDVRIKDGEKKIDRWRKIVVGATRQCGRAKLMEVSGPTRFSEMLEQKESKLEGRILFSERGGEGFNAVSKAQKMTAFVGPEGGWDDAELDAARAAEIAIVTLGGRILRPPKPPRSRSPQFFSIDSAI